MCYTDSVRSVGVDDGEVPPVPIPNTEVKLTCAEDSSWKRLVKIGSRRLEQKALREISGLFCCVLGKKIVS